MTQKPNFIAAPPQRLPVPLRALVQQSERGGELGRISAATSSVARSAAVSACVSPAGTIVTPARRGDAACRGSDDRNARRQCRQQVARPLLDQGRLHHGGDAVEPGIGVGGGSGRQVATPSQKSGAFELAAEAQDFEAERLRRLAQLVGALARDRRSGESDAARQYVGPTGLLRARHLPVEFDRLSREKPASSACGVTIRAA